MLRGENDSIIPEKEVTNAVRMARLGRIDTNLERGGTAEKIISHKTRFDAEAIERDKQYNGR